MKLRNTLLSFFIYKMIFKRYLSRSKKSGYYNIIKYLILYKQKFVNVLFVGYTSF